MSDAPSSYPCPYCGTAASAQTGCPSCGRGPDTDALEVTRLDAEITGLREHLHALRTQVSGLERRLAETGARRNAAALRVKEAVRATAAHQQEPPLTTAHQQMPPVPAIHQQTPQVTTAHQRTSPPSPPPLLPAPVEPRLSTLTVQNVLFALGGLLLLVAAVVFTAVAWAQVGVTGRALLLGGATVAVLAVPPFAARRGLTAAAETLAAVGLLMILLDGYAAWAVDLLGVTGMPPQAYAAVVCAVTAATALGYSRLVGLTGPRVAALVVAQPVLPLAAAGQDAGAIGWSLTLTTVAALNVAVLRLRRFTVDVIGILACVFGGSAAVFAGLLAAGELLTARTTLGAALAGVALILVSLVATGTAVLAGNRAAQSVSGGVLVVAVGAAVAGPALRIWPELLSLALIALALATAVLASRPLLPAEVRLGPWAGAYLVVAVPAVGVLAEVLLAAQRSVRTAGESWSTVVPGTGGEAVAATIAVVLAYVMILPSRTRTDLGLAALVAIALLVPAAFALPWWTAALAGSLAAAVSLSVAVFRTTDRSWSEVAMAIRLVLATVAAGHAMLVGLRHPGVGAAVCAALAVVGLVVAVIAHRARRPGDVSASEAPARDPAATSAPGVPARDPAATAASGTPAPGPAVTAAAGPSPLWRPDPAATVAWVVGLLAAPAAVWQALIAAGMSPTVQVRAAFAMVVLAVAVTCVVRRNLPGYAQSTLAVSLLLTAASPVWSVTGSDPVSWYAAGALLLLGMLAPPSGVLLPAALLPAVMLVISAGADIAAVLIEPLRELNRVWAGPGQDLSPVAWSTVAALLITAAAAALMAGTRPTRLRAAAWAAAPLLAVALPSAFAAAGATWPVIPVATLVTGLIGLLTVALLPAAALRSSALVVVSAWLAAVGVVSCLPTRSATLIAFGLLLIAAAVAGVAGRRETERIVAWVSGTFSLGVLAYTAADTAGLAAGGVSRSVLAAALVAVVLEGFLSRRRPAEAPAVAAVGHSTAVVALLLAGSPGRAAVICTLWSVVLAVRAMLPGMSRAARLGYASAAAVTVLLGWWLFLLSRDVRTPEVYTLPAAALALAVGWLARRGRPELPSWTAYGPSLGAAFLPTFAVIGNSPDPEYARRLLLGLGGLAVLILGARVRAQAPVVVGGGALTLIALHEVIQFWDLVPRWVPLALGGVLLLVIATTMEQRRRDLLRLRNAVGRMS